MLAFGKEYRARSANAEFSRTFARFPVHPGRPLRSIVFRYSGGGDLSLSQTIRVYGEYRSFLLFRKRRPRNSPTKWNVLRLAAGQLTNTRRQGLPKTAFALWKLRPASLDVTLQNNLNCTRNSLPHSSPTPLPRRCSAFTGSALKSVPKEAASGDRAAKVAASFKLYYSLRSCQKY